MTQKYLTTDEVAAKYRTQPSTVRYWRHIGYGPIGVKVGRRVLYATDELERFDALLAGSGCHSSTVDGDAA